MDVGGWLRSLGLEQYETAFQANAVNSDVLRDLTDQDLKNLRVLLGHRTKLLRAIAALDGALGPASAPRYTPLPIPPEAILAVAAKRATRERQQGQDHSVSSSLQPFPMASRLRSAEMIDEFLPSPEVPRLLLAASDGRHDDDTQTAETGEAHGANDYYDSLPSPRWRHRLFIGIAVIALVGVGGVGAFAYRAVFTGAVSPALPPIIKAEDASNENVPTDGDNRPSDLSQTSKASAGSSDNQPRDLGQTTVASGGSSEEFVSRWAVHLQEPPKTAPISSDASSSPPSAPGAVAPIAIAPATAHSPSIAPPSVYSNISVAGVGSGARTAFLRAEEGPDRASGR
jgi:SAM domain (Sterile alpha motif)